MAVRPWWMMSRVVVSLVMNKQWRGRGGAARGELRRLNEWNQSNRALELCDSLR